jgi:hypothetical protein
MTYSYTLHGLTLNLPFACPFLPEAGNDTAPDVTLTNGPVQKELSGATAIHDTWEMGFCWQAAPGRFLVKGGRKSGRFFVEHGSRITLHRNPEAEDERLMFHLLHPVSAALFRQRGLLTLHASTVNTPAGAIALCGRSGTGKSTTITAMLNNGCNIISDDVTVLRFGSDGRVEAAPGSPRMHLWEDAAKRLGLDTERLGIHPIRRKKRALIAPGEHCPAPAPLRKLCILDPCSGDVIKMSRMKGTDKLDALMDCVYGPLFREEHPDLFALFSTTVEQADIFHIQRPEGRWTVNEIVQAVLNG